MDDELDVAGDGLEDPTDLVDAGEALASLTGLHQQIADISRTLARPHWMQDEIGRNLARHSGLAIRVQHAIAHTATGDRLAKLTALGIPAGVLREVEKARRVALRLPVDQPWILSQAAHQLAASTDITSLTPPAVGPLLQARSLAAELREALPFPDLPPPLALQHLDSLASPSAHFALQGAMAEVQKTLPSDLFTELSRYRVPLMEWVPANLDEAGVERLDEVLRISQEDGVCLAWAPRTEIVVGLLERTSRQERQKYLVAHREEIADDVDESLNEVDHPALTDHVTFVRHAAACIREHHDTAAQALLGNVLDTVMAHHGRRWIRETFPDATFPGTGSHKTVAGAIATRPSDGDLRLMMITPHLLLSSLQDVFGPEDKQDTFNRHLGAHQASADSYRSAFAVAALLITHALLRQMDRYLHASE